MAGYRDSFIKSIGSIAASLPTELLVTISGQKLIHPFYHAISNEKLAHIDHLYPVKGTKIFMDDLDFLLKHFQPIDYVQFKSVVTGNLILNKPSFLLSFDDGLREFYDVIAPILIEKGVPAMVFLNSDFIDNKALFFRYKASIIIDRMLRNAHDKLLVQSLLQTDENPIPKLLKVTYSDKSVLDQIGHTIGLDFNAYLQQNKPYLSKDQIRSLVEKGFHFGAHSVDHPEFQYLDYDEQIRQTEESIFQIRSTFGLDYSIFSFPFTDYNVSQQFFIQLQQQNICDMTFGCSGLKTDSAPNHFQRIPLEMANLSAKQIVNAELLYFMAKWPFGRNKLVRHAGN